MRLWRRRARSLVGPVGRFPPVLSLCRVEGCESLPLGPFLDVRAGGGLREGTSV